jgi:hypothetical protein
LSYAFLDCLLDEFHNEVNDSRADRRHRPALDPEFLTALTVATIEDPVARAEAWKRVTEETAEVQELDQRFTNLIPRLRTAIYSLKNTMGATSR